MIGACDNRPQNWSVWKSSWLKICKIYRNQVQVNFSLTGRSTFWEVAMLCYYTSFIRSESLKLYCRLQTSIILTFHFPNNPNYRITVCVGSFFSATLRWFSWRCLFHCHGNFCITTNRAPPVHRLKLPPVRFLQSTRFFCTIRFTSRVLNFLLYSYYRIEKLVIVIKM